MVGALTIREGFTSWPLRLFSSRPPTSPSTRDFAAEAALHRVRVAAMIARDRLAEIEGVRVLGPEVSGDAGAVRLAIDLRDTGRDAWEVACSMASRGFPLDAASHRVIIVRLREEDIAEAHRTSASRPRCCWRCGPRRPPRPMSRSRPRRSSSLRGFPRVPGGASVAPPRSARRPAGVRQTEMPRRSSGTSHVPRGRPSPGAPTVRESALWLRCVTPASSCTRLLAAPEASRSSTSYSLMPSPWFVSSSRPARTRARVAGEELAPSPSSGRRTQAESLRSSLYRARAQYAFTSSA